VLGFYTGTSSLSGKLMFISGVGKLVYPFRKDE
jgi:hypothetical protein